jgi:hypothetical protein
MRASAAQRHFTVTTHRSQPWKHQSCAASPIFIFSFTFSLEFVHEYESDYAEVLYRSHEQCNATKVVK